MVPGGWFLLVLLLYVLSMLSKAAALGMPIVLLVLDVYPFRRLGGSAGWFKRSVAGVWLEKIPLVLLAGVFGVVALYAQHHARALETLETHGLVGRIVQAFYGLGFYAGKTIHPVQLGPIYEIPETAHRLAGRTIGWGVLALMITVLAIVGRRRVPGLLAAWFCYLVVLLPVLGVVQAGRQLVADRYRYLSCTGLALLAGGAWLWVRRQQARQALSAGIARLVDIGAVIGVAALMLMTFVQARVWQDASSLWQHAVLVSPDSAIARVNLGEVLLKSADYEGAREQFKRAIAIDERDSKAHNGLGVICLQEGEPRAALEYFYAAVLISPDYAHAWGNLGYVWRGLGEMEKAAYAYEQAFQLGRPDDLHGGRFHYACVLMELGRYGEADAMLVAGIERVPTDTNLLATRAWLLATCPDDRIRRGAEALELASRVCESEGYRNPYSLKTLAAALAEAGQMEHAITIARQALALATQGGLDDLITTMTAHLEMYEAGQAVRGNSE